jgi:DNA-binding NarL/FixJ family response regulator
MCTDIQDRREAEDTLRRNQAFFVSEAQRIGRLLGTPASQDDGTIAGQRATGAAGKTNAGERKLAAEHHVLETLTSHERAIIRLITQGKSNAEVGEALHLSPRTVEAYRARLMQKLHLDDVTALVKFAIRHGLASVE